MADGRGTNRHLVIGLVLSIIGVTGIICGSIAIGVHRAYVALRDRTPSVEIVTDGYGTTDLGGVEADDGELHDGRRTDVPYTLREDAWMLSDTSHLRAYDLDVCCDFSVRYPKVEGNLEQADRINALLEGVAKATVRTYYDDPGPSAVTMIRDVAESSRDYMPDGCEALLASHVDYAVTYNDENLLSVCFSDVHYLGTNLVGLIELRTVNVNLNTGTVYMLDDVLTVDERIATAFVDNLIQTAGEDENGDGVITVEECPSVGIVGREAFIQALQGKGDLGERGSVNTCLFIDGNGQPNLGVNYWVRDGVSVVHGWWDVTITDEMLALTRRDSELWELLGKE